MKLSDYLSAQEAADFLGIDRKTLYRWEEKNKIKVYRNPVNNYRMYKKEDLEKILEEIQKQE